VVEIAAGDRGRPPCCPAHATVLAAMAMEAHELLASYAPRLLRTAARAGWQQDAAAFSGWLSAFDATCRDRQLVSESRLPLELVPLLKADSTERAPILLAGFDRILPVQRENV